MKNLLLFLLITLPILASAQSEFTKTIEAGSLYDWTDKSYQWRIAGTSDDISEAFKNCFKYDAFSVAYTTTDTIGTDSVAIYIVLEGSSNMSTWIPLDSVSVTTVTTNYKSFAVPTGGMNGYRIRVNGVTGNGSDSRVSMNYWARKKADY